MILAALEAAARAALDTGHYVKYEDFYYVSTPARIIAMCEALRAAKAAIDHKYLVPDGMIQRPKHIVAFDTALSHLEAL